MGGDLDICLLEVGRERLRVDFLEVGKEQRACAIGEGLRDLDGVRRFKGCESGERVGLEGQRRLLSQRILRSQRLGKKFLDPPLEKNPLRTELR